MSDPNAIPLGVVGRVRSGREHVGFWVEVDDDRTRPGGSGGLYVLWWNGEVGYDDWVESADDLPGVLDGFDIQWMTPKESADIPGAHPHGPP